MVLRDAGFLRAPLLPDSFYSSRTTTIIGLYLLFLVVGTIERSASTFVSKRFNAVQSQISESWFLIPLYGYIGLVLLSIIEFFIRVQIVNLALSAGGLLIYSVGVVLRRRAIADLGDNWSFHTEIRPGHVLVTHGIYRFLKHPYYAAVICELVGACLVANAVYTAALVLLAQWPFLIIRIKLEESLLSAHFSAKYQNYAKGKLL